MPSPSLPLPRLSRCERAQGASAPIAFHTDEGLFERTGTRIGFTERGGGCSAGPYAGLDLASHVDDDPEAVAANIAAACQALGLEDVPLIRPNQVHGAHVASFADDGPEALEAVQAEAREGADAVLVTASEGAALLCFADCLPLILVAPSGAFAVVHAGWRGAVACIASKAARKLADAEVAAGRFANSQEAAGQCNAYLGPYIHSECFECGPDVQRRFVERFGEQCAPDGRHVDLGAAVRADLASAGFAPERIADIGSCTACDAERFYSYRASGGHCGRHGAIAGRRGGQRPWA